MAKYRESLGVSRKAVPIGHVERIIGLVVEGDGPDVPVGSICRVYPKDDGDPVEVEVVGFRDGRILMMPLSTLQGIHPRSKIVAVRRKAVVRVDESVLGRVLDGLGRPLDGLGPLKCGDETPLYADPVNPVKRKRITRPLCMGIRAINGLITCGRGQRIGIMSGTGVGKSVLLGMMAKHTDADVAVIAFIGERGREVREFIDKSLGSEGLKRSVLVTATSDNTPLVRLRAAFTATAIAEYFRKRGKDVLLLMDSLTRFAMAQREIGLSIGEPPATKGYTPSVFALLPRLLERAGAGTEDEGTITGLYTVLVEGDDLAEPISDASRAILDGHVVLSRALAERGHYPAIDPLHSVSRVMMDVVSPEHAALSKKLFRTLSVYKEAEDLINIGAYAHGSNPDIDYAIQKIGRINAFLEQGTGEKTDLRTTIKMLEGIF